MTSLKDINYGIKNLQVTKSTKNSDFQILQHLSFKVINMLLKRLKIIVQKPYINLFQNFGSLYKKNNRRSYQHMKVDLEVNYVTMKNANFFSYISLCLLLNLNSKLCPSYSPDLLLDKKILAMNIRQKTNRNYEFSKIITHNCFTILFFRLY